VLLVLSIAGFVTALVLNAFVFSGYDAYGEVPIPGSATLHLPKGPVMVSFHTQIIGNTNGTGLPVPDLDLTIAPPAGVAEPTVTESIGSTTTVNSDAHRQVWIAQIPQAGDYTIMTEGKVSAFISPRLAFGHGSPYGYLPWIFVGVFVIALLMLVVSIVVSARARKPVSQSGQGFVIPADPYTPTDADAYTPTDEGVRVEQLKTLASLHASGALSDQEFEAEKRRILGS
jgi:hypothetical protein